MRDFLTIGPVPSGEDCQQVPYTDPKLARKECRVFIDQLRRVFGDEPAGADFGVHDERHDFGTYCEVVVWYNDKVPGALEFAYKVEANTPELWDGPARQELGLGECAK